MALGKFHGVIMAATPIGSFITIICLLWFGAWSVCSGGRKIAFLLAK